uniref:Uncharacterized protein n=1 Tax=Panagrellus redivivus TaxID=6233 RepID=A0A7E4UT41_PANRE
MIQINVGKLSKVYHSMCRSFIPYEPPIVSFDSDAKPDDGDPKELYEQLRRPATPFHDAIPIRDVESETSLASVAISTSGLAPSLHMESRTPSGSGGMSDRTAIRTGIPDGGYRSSFAAIKSEICNVVPSSSNETLLSEFSSSVRGGNAEISESNETVSTKSRETEPIPVSPTNSDILRMLLPPSEHPFEASHAPEQHEPPNGQSEWKYDPNNDFPGVPMIIRQI